MKQASRWFHRSSEVGRRADKAASRELGLRGQDYGRRPFLAVDGASDRSGRRIDRTDDAVESVEQDIIAAR